LDLPQLPTRRYGSVESGQGTGSDWSRVISVVVGVKEVAFSSIFIFLMVLSSLGGCWSIAIVVSWMSVKIGSFWIVFIFMSRDVVSSVAKEVGVSWGECYPIFGARRPIFS
ncbi:23653_t:CDS:2, partial [Gigaspora rosea]